jgi:hypothetical protein
MFEEILRMVKEHFSNHPEISSEIPPEHADAVHREVADHITSQVAETPALRNDDQRRGGLGGVFDRLSDLTNSSAPAPEANQGGLKNRLSSKFGLSSFATNAIASALPMLIGRFLMRRRNA